MQIRYMQNLRIIGDNFLIFKIIFHLNFQSHHGFPPSRQQFSIFLRPLEGSLFYHIVQCDLLQFVDFYDRK